MSGRCLPTGVDVLRPFLDAGVLGLAECQVAATLAGTAPMPVDDDVVLAAALAVRGPLHGHVRVDLSEVERSVVPHERPEEPSGDAEVDPAGTEDEGELLDLPALPRPEALPDPVTELAWPDPTGWAERVARSSIGRWEDEPRGDRVEPLVVSGDAVYLDRYWRDECAVAEDLLVRATGTVATAAGAADALDRYLPSDPTDTGLGEGSGPGPDERQREAVRVALEHRLAVIAGGPGTGKTYTVARLLAVLADTDPAAEVVLAAPTGKAAARLGEAIGRAVAEADLPAEVEERLAALEPRTVHRLLGARGDGSFGRDRSDPLTADVVVVDEVSMVSLPLMARLLEAVRPDARLVLVGDPHQLASVEAGAVLGDVVGTARGATPGPLLANVVRLERIRRFAEGSAIAELAAAVNSGDGERVVQLLRHGPVGTDGVLRWIDPDDTSALRSLAADVDDWAAGLVDASRAGEEAAALAGLGELKVLAATRRGPLGVEDWNQQIERRLREAGRMRTRWSPGRPVMVTANDYLNGVFNGDVGIVVRDTDPARRRDGHTVHVAFEGSDGVRRLDPSRLADVETQWAMTIHKSQGSEFGRVVVTLPPPPSPILTRELLYTAVTRAKQAVTIVASEAAVRAAVARPVLRSSGLAERLA